MNLAQENGYKNFSMKTDGKRFCIYSSAFDNLIIEDLINHDFMAIVYCNIHEMDTTGWSLEMQVFKN